MPNPSKKRSRKVPKAPKKRQPTSSAASKRKAQQHEAAFIESLIESGQAAPLTKSGKLPAGATHKIAKGAGGKPKIVRRRFSVA